MLVDILRWSEIEIKCHYLEKLQKLLLPLRMPLWQLCLSFPRRPVEKWDLRCQVSLLSTMNFTGKEAGGMLAFRQLVSIGV